MNGFFLNFAVEVLGRFDGNTVCIHVNKRPILLEFRPLDKHVPGGAACCAQLIRVQKPYS